MVIVVMGVSGSGKTTVGRALALAIGGEFRDGDDYHTPESIAKMARGIPLTDDDRAPWLAVLRELVDEWRGGARILVLACSALTGRIRQRLGLERDGIRIVHLEGTRALLDARMRERKHFMPAELLESQLALLERPSDAVVLDAAEDIDTLVGEIRRSLSV
jgi:gluconokinase